MIHVHLAQERRYIHADVTGRGNLLLEQIMKHKPCRLHHVMAWATFTQTWPRPKAQHDVGEFLTFLLRRLMPTCMQGTWQSRLQDPTTRVFDTGTLNSPILLDISEGSRHVQDCVNAWHSQVAPHGLSAGAPVVLLQLGRFKHVVGKPLQKLQNRLEIGTHLRFPVFMAGLQTQWFAYHVVAGVYHIGRSPTSGHYRSFLTDRGFLGSAANRTMPYLFPERTVVTDDGVPAHHIQPRDVETICRNIYLLWCVYTRAENPPFEATDE